MADDDALKYANLYMDMRIRHSAVKRCLEEFLSETKMWQVDMAANNGDDSQQLIPQPRPFGGWVLAPEPPNNAATNMSELAATHVTERAATNVSELATTHVSELAAAHVRGPLPNTSDASTGGLTTIDFGVPLQPTAVTETGPIYADEDEPTYVNMQPVQQLWFEPQQATNMPSPQSSINARTPKRRRIADLPIVRTSLNFL